MWFSKRIGFFCGESGSFAIFPSLLFWLLNPGRYSIKESEGFFKGPFQYTLP